MTPNNDNTDPMNNLLLMRRGVDVPSGLAQRIINMAPPHRPRTTQRWADIWADIQAMFVIPRPAYALALAAIFGLIIGFDGAASSADPVYGNFTSFLQADAADIDMDEGSWL